MPVQHSSQRCLFIHVRDENLPFFIRFPFLGAKSVEIKYVRLKPTYPNQMSFLELVLGFLWVFLLLFFFGGGGGGMDFFLFLSLFCICIYYKKSTLQAHEIY